MNQIKITTTINQVEKLKCLVVSFLNIQQNSGVKSFTIFRIIFTLDICLEIYIILGVKQFAVT